MVTSQNLTTVVVERAQINHMKLMGSSACHVSSKVIVINFYIHMHAFVIRWNHKPYTYKVLFKSNVTNE